MIVAFFYSCGTLCPLEIYMMVCVVENTQSGIHIVWDFHQPSKQIIWANSLSAHHRFQRLFCLVQKAHTPHSLVNGSYREVVDVRGVEVGKLGVEQGIQRLYPPRDNELYISQYCTILLLDIYAKKGVQPLPRDHARRQRVHRQDSSCGSCSSCHGMSIKCTACNTPFQRGVINSGALYRCSVCWQCSWTMTPPTPFRSRNEMAIKARKVEHLPTHALCQCEKILAVHPVHDNPIPLARTWIGLVTKIRLEWISLQKRRQTEKLGCGRFPTARSNRPLK